MTERRNVAELVRLVCAGEATQTDEGAFLLSSGELFTPAGRATRHGASGYKNHGCRCADCRDQNSLRERFYRIRRQVIPDPDPWASVRVSKSAWEEAMAQRQATIEDLIEQDSELDAGAKFTLVELLYTMRFASANRDDHDAAGDRFALAHYESIRKDLEQKSRLRPDQRQRLLRLHEDAHRELLRRRIHAV